MRDSVRLDGMLDGISKQYFKIKKKALPPSSTAAAADAEHAFAAAAEAKAAAAAAEARAAAEKAAAEKAAAEELAAEKAASKKPRTKTSKGKRHRLKASHYGPAGGLGKMKKQNSALQMALQDTVEMFQREVRDGQRERARFIV